LVVGQDEVVLDGEVGVRGGVAFRAAAKHLRRRLALEFNFPPGERFLPQPLLLRVEGFLFGLVVFHGPAFLVAAQADGAVVVAAQARKEGEKLLEALPAFLGVGFLVKQGADDAGDFEREPWGEPIADRTVLGFFVADREGFSDLADEIGVGLLAEPVLVAALTPDAEVLLGDGGAVELLGQDGLDLVLGIKPAEEMVGGLAVVEALVDGVTEVAGETGDFTVASWIVHSFLGFTIYD
jgi:hypothetical protein